MILFDYVKGVLSNFVCFIEFVNVENKLVVVDLKGIDFKKYYGVMFIMFNMVEFIVVMGEVKSE